MQLEEQIGDLLQLSDIPANGLIWDKLNGYVTVSILNELYSLCLSYARCKPVDVANLPLEIPYEDIRSAFSRFKVLNLVRDVDEIVCENLQKGIDQPVKAHVNVRPYIDKIANKYLKFRPYQLDCDFILTALDSELYLFNNMVGLNIDVPYTPATTLRITSKPKRHTYIFNEAAALSRLKDLLVEEFDRFNRFVYELQKLSLKLRSHQARPCENADLDDFEL